ncbi:MAG: NUDIX hydrolase [Pseudomonadales bacterium]|nr:NUDIX hydrolase [Pseudomonadales bacterium]
MSNWTPHITVATVVENNDGFLLVHETDNGKAVFNQPAGHWDEGESLLTAAARETLEETGWRVTIDYLIGIYIYHSPHNHITYQRLAFAGTPVEQLHQKYDEGIIDALWLPYSQILARQSEMRSPLVLKVIDDYRSGHQYPLDMIHELPRS